MYKINFYETEMRYVVVDIPLPLLPKKRTKPIVAARSNATNVMGLQED